MEEALRAHLLANAAVAALVGTRITWLQRPQGSALPAITLQGVSTRRDHTLEGRDGLVGRLVQIDVWATTYATMKDIQRALISALDGPFADPIHVALVENERETLEAAAAGGTDLFRASVDVRAWFSEAL
jgi:hypothetical protein